MLADRGAGAVPAKSKITAIPRRQGLIAPAESTKRQPYHRFEHAQPNDLWQMDFKCHFPLNHYQASFDRWRHFYNLEQPHHTLALNTPARPVHAQPAAVPCSAATPRVCC